MGHEARLISGTVPGRSSPCRIENRSTLGALVLIDAAINLPKRFTVHDEVDGLSSAAELVWRKGGACGVRFISNVELSRDEATAGDSQAPRTPDSVDLDC